MSETLPYFQEASETEQRTIGRVTILEALAEESKDISVDMSHRSTQSGTGIDAEDD